MKSLLSEEKKCYVCGNPYVELHHVYGGSYRAKSTKYSCTVYLCSYHHRLQGGPGANNPIKEVDTLLKRDCQMAFEKIYGHDQFMKVFRRNYL